jgi:hypothetical protein
MTTRAAKVSGNAAGTEALLCSSLPCFQCCFSHLARTTLINVRGEVQDEDKQAFRNILFQGIENGKPGNIHRGCPAEAEVVEVVDVALDLSEVDYLSEEAIAVLIQLLKALRAQGTLLQIVRPSSWVRRKFVTKGLIPFFLILD